MFDGRTRHSPDEIRGMLKNIIECKKKDVDIPLLNQFKESIA
jgi:hypothetical protein